MRRTLLPVDGVHDVEVDGEDEDIAERVKSAAEVENVGVLEGDLLGDLHHTKDDDQVGAIRIVLASGISSPARDNAEDTAAWCSRVWQVGGDVSYTCGERPIVNMFCRVAERLER